ncbi:MAG: hypothetical protein N2110_03810 [Flavobacteriales bacterium]|nr:hypothetical protein [Flavobacteriales bacterium]
MTACKKGENDPFFSFKSRNARLKGTWKLVGKEAVLGNSVLVGQAPPVNYYVASTYDGTKEIMTITSNNITTKMVYYDSEITFSEKGDLSYSLFIYFLSDTLNQVFKTAAFQGTGTWVWNDMDKNKLGLQLIPDHLPIVPDTLNMGTLFPFELAGNYYLDRLSNKELWMKRSGTRTTQIDSIVTTTSFEIKWSFQKK